MKFGVRGKAFQAEGTACTRPRGSRSGAIEALLCQWPCADHKGREEPDVLSGRAMGRQQPKGCRQGLGSGQRAQWRGMGGNGIRGVEAGSYIPGFSPAQVAARDWVLLRCPLWVHSSSSRTPRH